MRLIDIHTHIAWGIDDGMPDEESAIQALTLAQQDGIQEIIATPHFVPGFHIKKSDIEKLNQRIDELTQLASVYEIKIHRGSEVFLNHEYLEMIDSKLFNPLGDSNYVLVEFDVRKDISWTEQADEWLYELTIRNYRPLIAHVERYFHTQIDLKRVRKWIQMGCAVQVNRTSILGLHGDINAQNARALLDNGLVHVIASDAHRATGNRICLLHDVYHYIEKYYSKETAKILLSKNPLHILHNEPLETIQVKKNTLFQRMIRRGTRYGK